MTAHRCYIFNMKGKWQFPETAGMNAPISRSKGMGGASITSDDVDPPIRGFDPFPSAPAMGRNDRLGPQVIRVRRADVESVIVNIGKTGLAPPSTIILPSAKVSDGVMTSSPDLSRDVAQAIPPSPSKSTRRTCTRQLLKPLRRFLRNGPVVIHRDLKRRSLASPLTYGRRLSGKIFSYFHQDPFFLTDSKAPAHTGYYAIRDGGLAPLFSVSPAGLLSWLHSILSPWPALREKTNPTSKNSVPVLPQEAVRRHISIRRYRQQPGFFSPYRNRSRKAISRTGKGLRRQERIPGPPGRAGRPICTGKGISQPAV